MVIQRRAQFVAIIGNASVDDKDIDKITAYCQSCAHFGFTYELGPRVYPKDQPIPYDSANWLQCYNCGEITPKVHSKQQNEIAPIVEPPEPIHDSNKVVALATKGGPSNKKRREIINFIKKTRPGAHRSQDYTGVDVEVRNALNAGKKLISYNSTNDEFEG